MEISRSDVHEILKVIDETENLDEVEVILGELRIYVRRKAGDVAADCRWIDPLKRKEPAERRVPAAAAPLPAPDRDVQSAPQGSGDIPAGMHAIKAPMLGTFYQSPSPGEPPFVQVGQRVKADDTVGVIEVMKLFNSISAGVDGVIAEVLVSDATLVEFGQVILLVKAD